jgi:hypothetical protein
MEATVLPTQKSWLGLCLSAIPALFLAFDGAMKLAAIPAVREGTSRLGFPEWCVRGLGVIELACLLVYLVPRTAPLGAVLLTGYLGGAVCTHVRMGDPLFTHVLFPIYVATMLWGGLALRDERARMLLGLSGARR